MLSHFRVAVVGDADAHVLKLHGELDVASGVVLSEALEQLDGSKRIVLDLADLEFIDSSGIGVLFKASQAAGERGQGFALVSVHGQVADLLTLTGMAERLVVADTLSDLPGG